MFCTKCGTQIPDDSQFCYTCGAPTKPLKQKDTIEENNTNRVEQAAAPAPQAQSTEPTAADEGIFGILGFALAFSFPLLGLIFSIMGLNKRKYSGFAMAGMILSIIFIVLMIIIIIVVASSSVHYYSYHIPIF